MSGRRGIWAVVPVKETAAAKQRLAGAVPALLRPALALAMFEDVLEAIAGVTRLAGIAVVTVDPAAAEIARSYGARVFADEARGGHTAAIAAAARRLAAEGADGMLQLPGDIPLVTAGEAGLLLALHRPAPAFTIAPARDNLGSNAVLVSPADAVPLTFGDDSFFPHLRAAQAHGIEPTVVRLPGIGCDIDCAEDLAEFARHRSKTRTQAFLDENGFGAQGAISDRAAVHEFLMAT